MACAIDARAGLDELRIYRFVLEARAFGRACKAGLGGFQKIFVVSVGEIRFVVCASGFVAKDRSLNYGAGELEHVVKLAGKGEAGIGPLAAVAEVDVFVPVEKLDDLFVCLFEAFVVADDGGVPGHGFAQFAPHPEGILGAFVAHQVWR